jgi:hypothetical protein
MCGYTVPEKPTFDWEKIKDILNPQKSKDKVEPKYQLVISDSNSGKFTVDYRVDINIDQFIMVLEEFFNIQADYVEDLDGLSDLDLEGFFENFDDEE